MRRCNNTEAKDGGAANGGDASGGYLGVIKRGDKFYSNVYNPVDGQFYPACMLGVATAEEAARLHDARVLELGLPPTELNFPPPGVLRREVPVIPVKQVAQPAAGNGGGGGAASHGGAGSHRQGLGAARSRGSAALGWHRSAAASHARGFICAL